MIQNLEVIKSQTHSAYLPYLPLEITLAEIWDIDKPSTNNNSKTPEPKSTPIPKPESPKKIHDKDTNPIESIIPEVKIELKTKEKPTLPDTIDPTPTVQEKQVAGDIYAIYKLYPNINKSISKTNKSLAIIFAQTQPVSITEKTLTIAVESDFYKSRLEKNSKIILDAILEHTNSIDTLTFTTQKVVITSMQDKASSLEDGSEPKDLNDTIADIFKDSL